MDGFWITWSKGAEEGLFRAYCRAGGPTAAGVDAFISGVLFVSVGVVWVAILQVVAGVLVLASCTLSVKVKWLMLRRGWLSFLDMGVYWSLATELA